MQHSVILRSKKLSLISLLVLLLAILSACGFQLRGMADIAFKSINIQGSTLSISRDLTRLIKNNGVKIAEKADDADLLLELMGETNEKRILSLSGGGLVREYEIGYQVHFRTRLHSNPTWSQVQNVQMRRDYSYDDKLLLGKAEEEARLVADMRTDAMHEIMRRLSAIKQHH